MFLCPFASFHVRSLSVYLCPCLFAVLVPLHVYTCPLDRILTISRVVIARIRGDPETRANLEMNGGGPIKIGAF